MRTLPLETMHAETIQPLIQTQYDSGPTETWPGVSICIRCGLNDALLIEKTGNDSGPAAVSSTVKIRVP